MDPSANLKEQLHLAAKIMRETRYNSETSIHLAQLVIALDEWLTATAEKAAQTLSQEMRLCQARWADEPIEEDA